MPKPYKGSTNKSRKGKSGDSNKRSAKGYGNKSKQKQVYTENNRKNPKSVNYSYPTDSTYGDY